MREARVRLVKAAAVCSKADAASVVDLSAQLTVFNPSSPLRLTTSLHLPLPCLT